MPKQTTPGTIGNGGSLLPAWLRALFAWRVVRDTGAVAYYVNDVTGERTMRRAAYQPVDTHWLETGEWSPPPTPPCGGPTERRSSIFPHFDVDAPMPSRAERPRDRRPSNTLPDDISLAIADLVGESRLLETLGEKRRSQFLASCDALDAAILRHLPAEKPRIRVPCRREPEVQIVDRISGSFTCRAPEDGPLWAQPLTVAGRERVSAALEHAARETGTFGR